MILFNMVTLLEFKQDISDALKENELTKMFMFTNIEEHSDQQLLNSNMNKKDLVVGYVEKIKLEVFVPPSEFMSIKKALYEIKGLEKNSYSWTTIAENLKL